MILEWWNKSCIELIALNLDPKNSLRSHLRTIMALNHSRLGVENKSGRIFCVRQVYFTNSCKQIWVRANQPFILFYTSRLRRKSTTRRCFYHTDLVQNAVFYNFSGQIAFIQYSGPSKHAWTFSETVQAMFINDWKQTAKRSKLHFWDY